LFIIRPQLQQSATASGGDLYRRFRWTVSAELVLAVMVLAVVGSLTSTQPARVEAAARTAPPAPVVSSDQGVTMADHVGATLVLLNVSPVRVGSNQLEIQLQDPAGGAARAAVRLRIVPPEGSGVSPWTVTPVLDGNIYRATAALAPEGNWKVEVLTANSEEPTAGAVFALDVPARGVRDLLTASATRMNRLQSAMEQVETFADGIRSVATVVYRAPDRERWTGNATEDSEITIGSNRFVRGANGRWIGEPVSHFHWPAFAPHEATEPMLLGRERVDDTECFVIAYVSPADGSRHRAWIATDDLRMLRHSEAAPGRFVVNHYSSFDAPVQIEAPALR
jgi:hypothetical protein